MRKLLLTIATIFSASTAFGVVGPLINGNQINPQTAISIASMSVTGAAGLSVTGPSTVAGTETVKGADFSVGGSSFSVGGGSATVAYRMTAGSFSGNGASLTSLTAANISAGTLGTSVIASSVAVTAVTSGSYGSATQVPNYTVGVDGRLTAAANTTISLTNSNLQSGTYSNVTVPAANVAAGSLGASVIASSIAVNSVGAAQLKAGAVSTNTFTGTVQVTQGGTGATTASSARSNLSAAGSGANSDITSESALATISSALTHTSSVTVLTNGNSVLTLDSEGGGTGGPGYVLINHSASNTRDVGFYTNYSSGGDFYITQSTANKSTTLPGTAHTILDYQEGQGICINCVSAVTGASLSVEGGVVMGHIGGGVSSFSATGDQYMVGTAGVVFATFTTAGNLTAAGNITIGGHFTAASDSVTASSFFGDGSHLTGASAMTIPAANVLAGSLGSSVIASSVAVQAVGDAQTNLSTGAIRTGAFPDARVSISTGAIASGKFGDNRVSITTGAFLSSFNGASQLVQLDSSSKLPVVDGSQLTNISGVLSGGTANFIPKWTAATTQGSSFISEATSSDTFSRQVYIADATDTAGFTYSTYNAAGFLPVISALKTGRLCHGCVTPNSNSLWEQDDIQSNGTTQYNARFKSVTSGASSGQGFIWDNTGYSFFHSWQFVFNNSSDSTGDTFRIMVSSGFGVTNFGVFTQAPFSIAPAQSNAGVGVYTVGLAGSTITARSDGFVILGGGNTMTAAANLASCGTSPTLATGSNNMTGKITLGTGGATGCILTFVGSWPRPPACVVTNETTANLFRATSTSSQVTFSGTGLGSDVLSYICFGM